MRKSDLIIENLNKVNEAGIRDIKETGKILSDINAKLKETDNKELLNELLKYITDKVNKDIEDRCKRDGEITIYGNTFKYPLSREDAEKIGKVILKDNKNFIKDISSIKLDYKILKPVFDNIGKVYKDLGSMFDVSYIRSFDEAERTGHRYFFVYYNLTNYDIKKCLKDGKIDDGDIIGLQRYFKNSIESYIKRKIPELYRYRVKLISFVEVNTHPKITCDDFTIDIRFALHYGKYPHYTEDWI